MLNKKKCIMLILCIIFLFNCSNTQTKKSGGRTTTTQSDSALVSQKMNELKIMQQKILSNGTNEELERVLLEDSLLKSFNVWKGTKYQLGGDSKNGIDCSALTRRIYRDVFKYELPRVSTDQAKVGRRISINNLKAGDILFFRPEGRTNHTAVYLGNSVFLNASSSQGVVLSSLESNYWGKYFQYGVRVDIKKS